MILDKRFTSFLSLLLLIPFLSIGQTATSGFTEKGTAPPIYKKIKLDNKVAYLHSETGKVITKSEYFVKHGGHSHRADHDHEFDHFKFS